MAIYLLPIFCFGVVITGIVLLGIKQASDLTKQLDAQANQSGSGSGGAHYVSVGQGTAPLKPLAETARP